MSESVQYFNPDDMLEPTRSELEYHIDEIKNLIARNMKGSSCEDIAYRIAKAASEGMLGPVFDPALNASARNRTVHDIMAVIAGHAAGHHNTPEQWRENAEGILAMAERAIQTAIVEAVPETKTFQARVAPWMEVCFGKVLSNDPAERNRRFLEEALELVQANGFSRDVAHQMVDHVFDRPPGDQGQEVGGVMITLAALCLAGKLNMAECGEQELARVWTMVEAIREKQKAKPTFNDPTL